MHGATTVDQKDDQPRFVVGLGASAGGLEAITALFQRIPSDLGMAFIVVQHLSPDFKSFMDEILRRHTELSVFRATDGLTVNKNAIYLIPPGKGMILCDGRLLLSDREPADALALPIDHFFRSLANDCAGRAIAVVLSGSGNDGSRGVREVHAQGGLVICQDVESSSFDGMPSCVLETGLVDFIGSPLEIAELLVHLIQDPKPKVPRYEGDSAGDTDPLQRIFGELRKQYGIDFSDYKPSTILRRIERRSLLSRCGELSQYVDRIVGDTQELDLLYKDLLIGVTQFFRDTEACRIVEQQAIPELLAHIPVEQEVRVWSAGCATGEEAYSLAILLHEQLTALGRPISARIFATDVHRDSLEIAARGIYADASLAYVTAARKERYFNKIGSGWRVSSEIRNLVVFVRHNLIKDAPFTRMDLVCCRNLLIYLQPPAQRKALSLFHFALKPLGTLLLGPSESLGDLADEFDEINRKWRVFRKRRDIRLSYGTQLSKAETAALPAPKNQPVRSRSDSSDGISDRDLIIAYGSLLADFVPMGILINDRNELLHSFGDVHHVMRIPAGRATRNILDMLPADLRTLVIGAIQKASRTNETVTCDRVKMNVADSNPEYRITVKQVSIPKSTSVHTFVSFQPLEVDDHVAAIPIDPDLSFGPEEGVRERIDVLESELRNSREQLQATIEQLEASNESLQSINEEMVASNEELQSTNEELHSVNEELYTVNADYQSKISELTELSHDMDNLLNSTDVPTLFLDGELSIRKFTPKMGDVFNLIATDVGRNIRGFSHNIPCHDLLDKVNQVLQSGMRYDEEVALNNGVYYLMRILPYLSHVRHGGVVLTLVDITESREAEARFRGTFENAAVGISHVALDGKWLQVNDRMCEILGYSRDEMLEMTFQHVTHPEDLDLDLAQFTALQSGELDRYSMEKRYIRKDGQLIWILLTVALQQDLKGLPQYAIAIVQDISRRKTFESGLKSSIEQRDRFLATLSHELRNPLAAVRHALRLFRHDQSTAEQRSAAMRTVHRQTDQMAFLLDDLLDVARITQGKIAYQMRPLDMCEVVRDAEDALRPTFEEQSHSLKVSLPQKPLVVFGDVSRLMQVVENLMTNACKYTDPGGKIEIRLRRYDGWCVLKVQDNGRGIDSKDVENVFDMFVQSDSGLARRGGGMGLGLTVVRSLVESHHGAIVAESPGPGKGSTFTVRIPLSELPLMTQQTSDDESLGAANESGPVPIVLVEDNDDAREMLSEFLELEGFAVTGCADGASGLEQLIKLQPSVALVDLGLPELTGYEVARFFRERCPDADTYLISLSGYGQTSDIMNSEAAGFNRHMTKPVDPDDLAATLKSLVK